jgi:hypothetical protein
VGGEDEAEVMPSAIIQKKKDDALAKTPIHYPFWFGGSASCLAACVTHPLDLRKLRGDELLLLLANH